MRIHFRSFSTRLSIYILLITTILFVISFSIYFNVSSQNISEEAFAKSNLQVENLARTIDAVLSNVEQSVVNSRTYAEESIDNPKKIAQILENMVATNSSIVGASIALKPYYYSKNKEYSMYFALRGSDGEIETELIGDADSYDYFAMDWYLIPVLKNEGYWSEPYFDAGAGDISMTTYTELLHDSNGEFIGVITADVPLSWITQKVREQRPYPNSYSFMLSRYGFYLTHVDSNKVLNETFFTATEQMHDSDVTQIGREMLSMQSGHRAFNTTKETKYAFFAPITRVGWSVGTVSSDEDILDRFNKTTTNFWYIISFALLLIFLFIITVIRGATKPLKIFTASTKLIAKGDFNVELPRIKTKDEMYELREAFVNMQHSLKNYIEELNTTTAARERIESELEIATTIQVGMLPTIFPPHPNLPDIDLFANLTPAKEVGGDLYDFFLSNGKLYFTVGDASGKGIPASLLMAVTSSLFRSVASHIYDPGEILYNVNNTIAETNDANMFITLFVGALDIKTGEIEYASAGHNAPVVVKGDGKAQFIDVTPALPLGALSGITYTTCKMVLGRDETMILYSDGLTEAENHDKELYSDERLLEVSEAIGNRATSHQFVDKIEESVSDFVKDNEQSDDLTILVLKLK